MAKLNKLKVAFISLVKKPANKLDVVYKSADGKFTDEKEIKIQKHSAEGLVYGTVYAPNVKDAHGDWADAQTIQKAAHEFMESGGNANIDENHNESPNGAKVVESHVNAQGGWDVVIKMDPAGETFAKVTKGELKGLSMGALCEKSEEEPPAASAGEPGELAQALKGLQDSLEKLGGRLDTIEKSVERVPKSRQLSIDGNVVNVHKNDDKACQEFVFGDLA